MQEYSAKRSPEGFWRGATGVLLTWYGNKQLIWQLTQREVLKRYRGSILGLTWSILNPLVLMMIYATIFSLVLNMKWSADRSTFGEFALMLFCGLIPFEFMGEVLGGSTQVITRSPNYVRRIAFPVEILPCVEIGSAVIHSAIKIVILLCGIWFLMEEFHWTFLLLPFLWTPFLLLSLAFSLFVAGAGVFIRDLQHLVGLVMSGLFFLTPIFYPASMVPEKLQWILLVNPIAYLAANTRIVCVEGLLPNWKTWVLFNAVGSLLLLVVAGWFQLIRKRFSDVL
ncbi:ABC transporter permease [bacterium]|nr:ABC transporter permease [bacterium]